MPNKHTRKDSRSPTSSGVKSHHGRQLKLQWVLSENLPGCLKLMKKLTSQMLVDCGTGGLAGEKVIRKNRCGIEPPWASETKCVCLLHYSAIPHCSRNLGEARSHARKEAGMNVSSARVSISRVMNKQTVGCIEMLSNIWDGGTCWDVWCKGSPNMYKWKQVHTLKYSLCEVMK